MGKKRNYSTFLTLGSHTQKEMVRVLRNGGSMIEAGKFYHNHVLYVSTPPTKQYLLWIPRWVMCHRTETSTNLHYLNMQETSDLEERHYVAIISMQHTC